MAFLSSSIKKVFLFALVMCCGHFAMAQLKATTIESASDLGNNCFQITPDIDGQVGGVWFDYPIDFSNDFTIAYQNYFGNDNDGADGMALVFKLTPDIVIGGSGGGLGYEGIPSSLIIEFDTHHNPSRDDPSFDHIALMSNGSSYHTLATNLSGPVNPLVDGGVNIEDDLLHDVKVEWIATTKTLNVYFDCQLRLSKTQDFKSGIFNNDNAVYFGFVGATGAKHNRQEVCLNRVSFIEDFIVSDETICLGESILKDVSIHNGINYSWEPSASVSDPNSANPMLSPTVDTRYTVSITDLCGETFTEFINVTIAGNSIVPRFNPIPNVCEGESLVLPSTSLEGIIGAWSPEPDNTKTTEYTFYPHPGQCAAPTTVIVNVLIPTFNIPAGICEGEQLSPLPGTSIEGIVGSWSPELNNKTPTVYTFTPDVGQCAHSVSRRIDIYSTEALSLKTVILPDSFSESRTIEMHVTGGSGFYEYQLDEGVWQSEAVFENVSRCNQHDVGVRDVYSCAAEVREVIDLIFYPKFFTPNGDGYHEFWNIKCLETHPEAVVFIYNRHGALLKQIKPSQNGWNGTYRGTALPNGSYWFVAHYRDESNRNKQLRGYFALKR
ncbi:T9SS type B sorting domain-containing protein [Algibacter sp. TI.3.09]|uniref:lectin-like domain-containing protein n=1 Tax=Algibacter sp. TI.3.09 TaxID=3121298 RepID=UPI00311E735D